MKFPEIDKAVFQYWTTEAKAKKIVSELQDFLHENNIGYILSGSSKKDVDYHISDNSNVIMGIVSCRFYVWDRPLVNYQGMAFRVGFTDVVSFFEKLKSKIEKKTEIYNNLIQKLKSIQ